MADPTKHKSDTKMPPDSLMLRSGVGVTLLPPIIESPESSPATTQRDVPPKKDEPVAKQTNAAVQQTVATDIKTQSFPIVFTRKPLLDQRVKLLEQLQQRKINTFVQATTQKIIHASSQLLPIADTVTTESKASVKKQPSPTLELVHSITEQKEEDIALEIYALDINVSALQKELQKAAIFVQPFLCMYLLRTYEREHLPTEKTIRLYLLNTTAWDMETNKGYLGTEITQLHRFVVPYEMETTCCFFSKPLIHNPINPGSNEEIRTFLTDTTDLNFAAVITIFDTLKQKLRMQAGKAAAQPKPSII